MIVHDMESIEHRIRIDLRPRVDLTFRAALERACLAASVAGAELDTPEAARIVEEELRSGGYPDAEISLFRSVEEYRNRVSNWVAWRDGRPREAQRSGRGQAPVDRTDCAGQASMAE
jgi:hypothetical protein